MNTWYASQYAARVVSDEKIHEAGREHIVLDRIQVKALVTLFRNIVGTFL